MIAFPVPRLAFAALTAAFFFASVAALADDVQEASKLLRAGQPQQALERVNKVLAGKPRDPQARFLKGLIFADQGNAREATEIFLKLTQDYPELPEPYNNLAVIYAAQGQYDKARAALEQSIRTHPSYATAYENLGDVYAKLASQAYDKALQIDSSNAGAQNKLALVRELVGGAPRGAKPIAVAQKEPAKEPAKTAAVAAVEQRPAPEKPVAAKPADAEVIETLNAWAKAWSAKQVDAYLAYYARDFQTPKGEPRDEWENGRRQRISAPKSISVSVEAPKVSLAGANQASVTFRQAYRSDVVKATGRKTLVLVKVDGRWLIQQEKVAN
ncbi:MAG: Wzy polymerase domain-containing protein [Burkholderiales bacterium]